MTGIRHRILAAMGLAGALALGGCYDDGYGYGGVSVGTGYYGNGYYGGGYADPYYGSGYYPGYGWYDNFYYPGSGYYVYDRGGRRHRWNDGQRRYWEGRRGTVREGDRNWRDRDRNRPPGDGNWGQRPPRDGDGNWTRPRPPQGQGQDRGRWRNSDGARPTPQPGLRAPQQGGQPQMTQPRPQRNWDARPPRADRPMRGPGRDPAPRTRDR